MIYARVPLPLLFSPYGPIQEPVGVSLAYAPVWNWEEV